MVEKGPKKFFSFAQSLETLFCLCLLGCGEAQFEMPEKLGPKFEFFSQGKKKRKEKAEEKGRDCIGRVVRR